MRDPKRINKILKYLESVWNNYPDLRFWQLVAILEREQKLSLNKTDLFYVEDDITENFLKKCSGKE